VNIGVFACDPGGATGLAWGIFNPHAKSIEEMLSTRMDAGSTTVTGDERAQIREVAALWSSFYSACVRSALLPIDHVWLVFEDFVYAPGVNYEGESAKISTALIWGIEGYRMGKRDAFLERARGPVKSSMPSMMLQTASEAKTFATNARLKEWGVWVVGREHERSAWQHIAYFLKRYRIQFPAK
jgi:hypothetical protein